MICQLPTIFFSAFDPIFFLVHARVDRLLSLWFSLNPDVWVSPGHAVPGSLTLDADDYLNEHTGTLNSLNVSWNILTISFNSLDAVPELGK